MGEAVSARELDAFYDLEPEVGSFLEDVFFGLTQPAKTLPCKFFYDERGSRLFDDICALEEYYPTRTEVSILERHTREIGARLPEKASVIEFGSGSADKVRVLWRGLRSPGGYVPIDISRRHLVRNASAFAADHPSVRVTAICADFSRPIDLDGIVPSRSRIGFFPGSTIGNFSPLAARALLEQFAATLGRGGALVIGVDLKKDPRTLERAYNDRRGVTAAFNLNLLRRINRELEGNFDVDRFAHRAFYNEAKGRVEMHLVSKVQQEVRIADRCFSFAAGENIHTESSYKYEIANFRRLAARAGFRSKATWTDAAGLFSVQLFALA